MNLTDLASFVRVADLGTITAAALAEGVPKSTISRRIARLEDELGVELLRRSARSFTLTDDGHLLHARSAPAIRELSSVGDALNAASGEPHGRLVITTPADFGRTRAVAALFADYRRLHPNVTLDLRLENRVVDLVAEGMDLGIRLHGGQTPGGGSLMSRSLGRFTSAVYASPAYVAAHGAPTRLQDLLDHDVALHKAAPLRTLRFVGTDGAESVRVVEPAFESNDFGLIHHLVRSGAAIALLPLLFAAEDEGEGVLVRLLPEWSTQSGHVSLVWPPSRHLAPRVRAFIDLAVERLREEALLSCARVAE